MPSYRDAIPDDLKEFIGLIRTGQLYAVQDWIKEGNRFVMPPGRFITTPFRAALETGFHSMIEVMLKAGASQCEKDCALWDGIQKRRLDLIELAAAHGADLESVGFSDIISCRHPEIIKWFIERGVDWNTGFPIAEAFIGKHREFLGIYMTWRDKIPTARVQAIMALKHHAKEGNLKWVSLLMWAGADPRVKVSEAECDLSEYDTTSALEEAVHYGQLEIVKKIGIRPSDNASELLSMVLIGDNPDLIEMLLSAGADPNARVGDHTPMDALMRNFEWSLDSFYRSRNSENSLEAVS